MTIDQQPTGKIEYIVPPTGDTDLLDETKDILISNRDAVEEALKLPGDEGIKEIINILNDAPSGTPVEIIEMDWA